MFPFFFLDAEIIHPINPGLVILNAKKPNKQKNNNLKRLIPLYRKQYAFLIFDIYYISIIRRIIIDFTVCSEMAFIDFSKILKSISTFSINKVEEAVTINLVTTAINFGRTRFHKDTTRGSLVLMSPLHPLFVCKIFKKKNKQVIISG